MRADLASPELHDPCTCVALLTLWQGDQGVAFLRFLPLGGDLGVGLVFIFGLQGCQTALMLFLGSNAKRARLIS